MNEVSCGSPKAVLKRRLLSYKTLKTEEFNDPRVSQFEGYWLKDVIWGKEDSFLAEAISAAP